MEEETCGRCGKVIEGYTKKHAETLMAQHGIKHRNEDRKLNQETNTNGNKRIYK